MITFPVNFLWGAATSAYQVEGDNVYTDWWHWEKSSGQKEFCGPAAGHYRYFEEDFNTAKLLHHTCHRLSIEWSRVEPHENQFSAQEIAHYIDVITALRERNIQPIVTLHHFTNPEWLSRIGGWENPSARDYFIRYVEKIVGSLSAQVRYWIPVNEPMVYVYHAYVAGIWPPQKKSLRISERVAKNLLDAHTQAYKLIHEIYRKKDLPAPLVGIAHHMQAFVACRPTLRNKLGVYLRDRLFNLAFLKKLSRRGALDFIGVNYYTRGLVETRGWGIRNLLLDFCVQQHSRLEKNDLGWDIYPQGIYASLLKLKKFKLPVFVTENGICTHDDARRWQFIADHLKYVAAALEKGVDVRGYIYWSLLDNYEWDKGFSPRFGLINVDYRTGARTVRESARKFAGVCQTGKL
jgi:beta-glucosidase